MMRIREIVEAAGRPVVKIQNDASVEDAIARMAEKASSSLIVVKGQAPAGIFTEHDIVKAFTIAHGKPFSQVPIQRTMTNKPIVATPDDELDSSISLMLKADIRHLPVKAGEEIIAILNLCDLVHYRMEVLASEMKHLEDYVKDLHGAMTD
jgi:IMP dehydrogenase